MKEYSYDDTIEGPASLVDRRRYRAYKVSSARAMIMETFVDLSNPNQNTQIQLKNYQLNKTINYRANQRSCVINGEDTFDYPYVY